MKGTLRKERLAVGECDVRIFPAFLKVIRISTFYGLVVDLIIQISHALVSNLWLKNEGDIQETAIGSWWKQCEDFSRSSEGPTRWRQQIWIRKSSSWWRSKFSDSDKNRLKKCFRFIFEFKNKIRTIGLFLKTYIVTG